MNPIVSYKDFLDYNKWMKTTLNSYVPVVLMRPVSVLMMNENHYLDYIFDYYDHRTGEIQFFFPGYMQNPSKGL